MHPRILEFKACVFRTVVPAVARALNALSLEATLFATVFLTYAFFYQGGGFNEAARFDAIRAFLEQGNMTVDRFAYNSADLVKIGPSYYSSKAPGTFLLGAPIFGVVERALRLTSISDSMRFHMTCLATTLLTISLFAAFAAVAMCRVLRRMGAPARRSVAVALAIALGSNFFPFATLFMSHALTASFLFVAFAIAFGYRQDGERPAGRALIIGALLGFAIALEYPGAIGAAIVGLYGAYALLQNRNQTRNGKRAPAKAWAMAALGFAIGLAPMAWHNWIAFHDMLYVPYEAYRNADNVAFQAHRQGVLGIRIALLEPAFWPTFLSNLRSITIAPIRGLFYACPVLLLAFPGFVRLARKGSPWRPEACVAAAMLAAYVTMNASFGDSIQYWGGGTSFGPRHVIAALPFLALPMASALEWRWARRAFAALAPISILFCLMATAVEPRAPYEPANPIFSFYAPKFFTGALALNANGIFSNDAIHGGTVAFNWGKLAGLPGALQLWPLYAFWLFAAFAFDRKFDRNAGGGRRKFLTATGIFVAVVAFLQSFGGL